ncbi:acyl-CoA dehydrogenase family protein [Loktanella sp. DJP18]|uniref:acyl-CoA dehydrogenase family protein n=1 Tax=Loktanella sp. DJP18 TaxID=3409788 RepID=UPI003BB70A66
MTNSRDQQRRTLALLDATPAWHRLCAVRDDLDDTVAAAILDSAGRFSDDVIGPLNIAADRVGCTVAGGRVRVPEGYHAAWRGYADGGWIGIDLPEDRGGSGLPVVLQAAAAQIFDRGGIAFNMATGASRSGAVLLAEHAPDDIAADWVPALISGARTATICISEPGAGSDVGRIRTVAALTDGGWRVTGDKIWISFGDHDLTPMIGHCLLARTSDAPGTRGLSLFLVPSAQPDGHSNGVSLLRIEDKMGLHGSPTCALHFDRAEATLIGKTGHGLSQLFTMIELMRLQTGCQGLGIASLSCDVAIAFAQDRVQGGPSDAAPVPIASHPDVQRQLRWMRGQTEILRAAVLELATQMDLARSGDVTAAAYTAWLLPLIKTFGAETASAVANAGLQVLGGAGYTADWPLEQAVRDARVLAIYEGTTGMQAIDFLDRRLIRDRGGLDAFMAQSGDITGAGATVLAHFAALAETLRACPDATRRLWAADAWLRAGWLALTVVLAPRVAISDPDAAHAALAQIVERFAVHDAAVRDALR